MVYFIYQLKNEMNFLLSFLLNLSITPLLAEELYELYAVFLMQLILSVACAPEEDLCRIAYQKWCPVFPLPEIGIKYCTKFVVRIL